MADYGDRFNSAVAAELRAQRARGRVTFDELVKSTGLSRTAINTYLNGQRAIPMIAFADLCQALNIDLQTVIIAAENSIAD